MMKKEMDESIEQEWNRREFLRRFTSGVGLTVVGVSAWELAGCQTETARPEGDGVTSNDGGGRKDGADTRMDRAGRDVSIAPDQNEPSADAPDAADTAIDSVGRSEKGAIEYPTEPTPEIPSHEEPIFEELPDTRVCRPTDPNIEGPYYRKDAPWMTQIAPPNEPGTPLLIEGIVFGPDCRTPLANMIVDVWQANDKGSYDNDGQDDPPNNALHLRGRMRTNAQGQYKYTTIMPGRYLNGKVFRPAHIHYKVYGTGFNTLTTQLYFAGDPYIKGDPFVRPGLIIPTKPNGKGLRGTFHIVLTR